MDTVRTVGVSRRGEPSSPNSPSAYTHVPPQAELERFAKIAVESLWCSRGSVADALVRRHLGSPTQYTRNLGFQASLPVLMQLCCQP
jgi:hypothetical protein